jgi:hypothetical protein
MENTAKYWADYAANLRWQAHRQPPSAERNRLLSQAAQLDIAVEIAEMFLARAASRTGRSA